MSPAAPSRRPILRFGESYLRLLKVNPRRPRFLRPLRRTLPIGKKDLRLPKLSQCRLIPSEAIGRQAVTARTLRRGGIMTGLKTSLSGLAVLCALGGAAHADDYLKGMLDPTNFAQPLNWSGPYVGATLGYAWSGFHDQLALSTDSPTGLWSQGGAVGAIAGYNMQSSNYVLGIETEFNGAQIGATVHDQLFGDNFKSSLNDFGALRSRLGYAYNRALFYVDGGLAYGNLHSNVNGPALLGSPYSFSGVATGYTLGAGVEYAVTNNWSVRAEYLYMDFGKNDPTNAAGMPYSGIAGGGFATVRRDAYNLLRLGVVYSFK
ncbi:MAG: porin family protein [Bradyrhizobium sp.]|nr:MAG: porin family protein [Bradyrhizobium sp.]